MTVFTFDWLTRYTTTNLTLHSFIQHTHEWVFRLRWILQHWYTVLGELILPSVFLNILMPLTINYLRLQFNLLKLFLLAHVVLELDRSTVFADRHLGVFLLDDWRSRRLLLVGVDLCIGDKLEDFVTFVLPLAFQDCIIIIHRFLVSCIDNTAAQRKKSFTSSNPRIRICSPSFLWHVLIILIYLHLFVE